MQPTPPMVIASAPKAGAVQPRTRNTAAVAIKVAIVMPETGLAEEPTRPTMRELTVTNRNPKTTTSREAARFAPHPTHAPGTGLNSRKMNMHATIRSEPMITMLIERSFSVRIGFAVSAPAPDFMDFNPVVRALQIVGTVLRRVIRPAAATAPAPIGFI